MSIELGRAVAYLDMDLTNFNNGIVAANSSLQRFMNSNNRDLNAYATAIGSTMSNIGSSLTRTISAPLVSLGESAVQASRDYESAFTGVRKTVDATAEEYEQLSKNIKKMATETASSAEDIAGVMEIAGQLGINLGKNGEEITKFTKVMVELGDSTNLSAAEAADSLARFMNITGTATKDVDKLGSTVVDLGNNFATNEDEIVTMATRLASAGTVAGLTEQEILALSTAISSVGIRAEAGASSMSTTLTQIEKIVNGVGENSEETLTKLASVAGMTAEEFAESWKNEPIKALTAFLYGLGQINEADESMIVTLDELGMSSIRQGNLLRALGLSSENLADALEVANKAWDENTALTIEANKRYETLDSKISQLNERWKEMKRQLAEVLIPYLEKFMGIISKLIEWFTNLNDGTKKMIVTIAAVVAALGPVVLILGQLISSFGQIGTAMGMLNTMFTHVFEAMSLARAGFVGFANETSLLGSVIGQLGAGPLAALVVGIMAVVTAIVQLWNESESFRNNIIEIWNAILDTVKRVWDALKPVFDALIEAFFVIVDALKPLIEILVDTLKPIIIFILDLIAQVAEIIGPVLVPIIKILSDVISILITLLTSVLEILSPIIKAVIYLGEIIATIFIETTRMAIEIIGVLLSALQRFTSFIRENFVAALEWLRERWDSLWNDILNVGRNVTDAIKNVVKGLVDGIVNLFKYLKYVLIGDPIVIDLVEGIYNIFKNGFEKVKEVVSSMVEAVINFFKNLFNTAINLISNFVNSFISGFNKLKESVENIFTNVINSILSLGSKLVDEASKIGKNFIDGLNSAIGNVKDFFSNFMEDALSVIVGFASKFVNAGKTIMSSVWNGFKGVWESITSWFSEAVQKLFSSISGIGSKIKESVGSVLNISGSHASGLDYVPYDGYVAELHKGERVLTKSENERYSENKGNGGDTFIFNSPKQIDEYEAARQLKRAKRELQFG